MGVAGSDRLGVELAVGGRLGVVSHLHPVGATAGLLHLQEGVEVAGAGAGAALDEDGPVVRDHRIRRGQVDEQAAVAGPGHRPRRQHGGEHERQREAPSV